MLLLRHLRLLLYLILIFQKSHFTTFTTYTQGTFRF